MAVRRARPADVTAVCNVLDGAALETRLADIRASVERGETFVAVTDPASGPTDDGTVVGALVRDRDRIVAVAVRRGRRGQGVGSALVEAAIADGARLTAEFDDHVRPFYESLDFEVEPVGEDRWCGVLDRSSGRQG